jgi:hypothetical protein
MGIIEYLKPDNLPEKCAFAEICKSYGEEKPTCNRQESASFCGYQKRAIDVMNKRYRSLDLNLVAQKINEIDEYTKRVYPCDPANRTLDEMSQKLGELRGLLRVTNIMGNEKELEKKEKT